MGRRARSRRTQAARRQASPGAPAAEPGTPAAPQSTRGWLIGLVLALVGTAATGIVGWFVTFGLDRAATSAEAPVRVRLLADPATVDVFGADTIAMVLPSRPATDPPNTGCQGFHDWALRAGGVDLRRTAFRVVVQGASDRAVVIDRVSARVLSRDGRAPVVGVECPPAANMKPKTLDLDLDAQTPGAVFRPADGQAVSGVTLSKGETEYLDVVARTAKDHVTTWALVLELTVEGEARRIEVRNGDRPFRTTAARPETGWSWGGGTWRASP